MGQDFAIYLRSIRDGLLELKKIDKASETQILRELSMSNDQYTNASMRFPEAFEESESHLLREGKNGMLSLHQVREGIQYQK